MTTLRIWHVLASLAVAKSLEFTIADQLGYPCYNPVKQTASTYENSIKFNPDVIFTLPQS